MLTLPTTIIFKKESEEASGEIIIPEEFIKDYYLSSDSHLMVILRVIGTDSEKVIDFFNNSEGKLFTIKITENNGKETTDEYKLESIYMDEGPSLSVDINAEEQMVRTILDFEK